MQQWRIHEIIKDILTKKQKLRLTKKASSIPFIYTIFLSVLGLLSF